MGSDRFKPLAASESVSGRNSGLLCIACDLPTFHNNTSLQLPDTQRSLLIEDSIEKIIDSLNT